MICNGAASGMYMAGAAVLTGGEAEALRGLPAVPSGRDEFVLSQVGAHAFSADCLSCFLLTRVITLHPLIPSFPHWAIQVEGWHETIGQGFALLGGKLVR